MKLGNLIARRMCCGSAAAVLLVSACSNAPLGRGPNGAPSFGGDAGGTSEPPGGSGGSSTDTTIRLATFNIQDFGPTKLGRSEDMDQLVAAVRKYAFVAVQEISDVNQVVPYAFLDQINQSGGRYEMLLSPRSGQQENDRTYQEQYAFFYDATVVAPLSTGALYDDSTNDSFVREPYVARFSVINEGYTFVAITAHLQPDTALDEITRLDDVFQSAKAQFADEDDFVLLGDLNAGCSYATPAELDALRIRGGDYVWIVPDDADTNLAMSECAYDRIVISQTTGLNHTGTWGVDRSFTDTTVSDHWPVWADFWVDER